MNQGVADPFLLKSNNKILAFFMKKSRRYWVCFGQRVIDFMKNRLEVFFQPDFSMKWP